MSPLPTDVAGYRSERGGRGGGAASAAGATIQELDAVSTPPAAPIPLKGVALQRDDSSSCSSHGGGAIRPSSADSSFRGRPPPISTTALPPGSGASTNSGGVASGGGGGPGNMPSGISVQELKQMTALRMAHEQGHLHVRVVSPFQYGAGSSSSQQQQQQQQQQPNSRGPSPSRVERDHEHSSASISRTTLPRTPSSRSVGGGSVSGGDNNTQRPRRHSVTDSLGSGPGNPISPPVGAGDIPPTPSSSCSGSSRSGGGARSGSRRSPSPAHGGRRSPAPVAPTTSAMPHGLTVQELKVLTKMRLARENFNIPVYAVLQASAQQPSGTEGKSGGATSRGRPNSPTPKIGRHPHSRSPGRGGGDARSTPSSPGGGDRPHRRTRRGGRRGRNRSPRPDGQYSPKRSEEGGYSSASPSPRLQRSQSDRWAEHEEQPRSSSQPRTISSEQFFSSHHRGPHHAGGTGAGGERRGSDGGAVHGGGGGGGGGGRDTPFFNGSPGVPPHVDAALSAPSGGGGSGGSGGGRGSNGHHHPPHHMAEAFAVLEHQTVAAAASGRRPSSLPLASAMAGLSHGMRPTPTWDPHAGGGGKGSPQMRDAAMLQEVERRRGDSEGRGSIEGDHHRGSGRDRGGAVLHAERPRSMHNVDRRYMADTQPHYQEREAGGRRVAGMIGREHKTTLRGFDPRDEPLPPPPGHRRMHRANSEGLVDTSGRGSRLNFADPRFSNFHNHGGGGGGGGGGGRGGQEYEFHESQHRRNGGGGSGGVTARNGGASLRADDIDSEHHPGSRRDGYYHGGAPGSWGSGTSPSLPPQAPYLATRRSDGGAISSAHSGHGLGGSGGGGGGGSGNRGGSSGTAGAGGVRHGSSSSPGDSVRDDIWLTVAESVLAPKNAGGAPPGQWRNKQAPPPPWHGAAPPGAMLASPSAAVHDKDGLHGPYADHGPYAELPHVHHAADEHQTLRREQSSGGGAAGASLRGLPHLQNNPHSSHQPSRHDYRGGRDSGPTGYGGGGERHASMPRSRSGDAGAGLHSHDFLGTEQTELLRGISGSGGSGGFGPHSSGHASPNLPSQSPMLSGARYPGSAPNPFHRESFPVIGGETTVPSGGLGGGASGGGSRSLASPVVGSLGAGTGTASDGRGSPMSTSSPLMAGLTFSLDLAGCGGKSAGASAGGQAYSLGAVSDSALNAHGSSSDLLGFDATDAGAGSGSRAAAGLNGSGAVGFGSGSGSVQLADWHDIDGGGLTGASSASHRSAGAGPSQASSLPRQLDIGPSLVGGLPHPPRVDTSLFSFGQASAADEIGGRRQSRSVSSTPVGGTRAPGSHPGTIGSSRSNSAHSSPVLSNAVSTTDASGTDTDVVFPALEMGSGDGGGGSSGGTGGQFLGVY